MSMVALPLTLPLPRRGRRGGGVAAAVEFFKNHSGAEELFIM
jgi:hypothetical protein